MRRPFGQFPYKFVQITSQSDGSPLKAVQGAAVVSTFTSGLVPLKLESLLVLHVLNQFQSRFRAVLIQNSGW